ncbi:hypothetical protein U9M48_036730 [Paspalum notatum var. saurae]|uniref:Uncharacterized protein n=1 Tax=Paspalum notatum var. saurae TaxID=547442 RepID=A0AAQ3UHT5_PASNO
MAFPAARSILRRLIGNKEQFIQKKNKLIIGWEKGTKHTGNEESTQQLLHVEEPEDQEPVNPEQEEYPRAAPDFAIEETNPNGEGTDEVGTAAWGRVAPVGSVLLALFRHRMKA